MQIGEPASYASFLCEVYTNSHILRIYPYPMVWPPSETMCSEHGKPPEIKGFLGLERPFLDLVSQTPRRRGRGRPFFAEIEREKDIQIKRERETRKSKKDKTVILAGWAPKCPLFLCCLGEGSHARG